MGLIPIRFIDTISELPMLRIHSLKNPTAGIVVMKAFSTMESRWIQLATAPLRHTGRSIPVPPTPFPRKASTEHANSHRSQEEV